VRETVSLPRPPILVGWYSPLGVCTVEESLTLEYAPAAPSFALGLLR
jgi:hypothetical protein